MYLNKQECQALATIIDIVKNSLTIDDTSWNDAHNLPKMIKQYSKKYIKDPNKRQSCVDKLSKLLVYPYKGLGLIVKVINYKISNASYEFFVF